MREAEKLGATHNERIDCRSGYSFQLAAALQLGCRGLLTFDFKQEAMARAAALAIAC